MSAARRRILQGVLLAVGLAGFAAIPLIVGVEDTLAVVGHVGLTGFVLYTANFALTLVLPAVGWWLLVRASGIACPLRLLVRANFMGYPINVLTPSLYLGSEPLKTLYIADRLGVQRRRVLATVIAAKFQEVTALILWMVVAVWLATWRSGILSARVEVTLVVAAGICVAGWAVVLWGILGRWNLSVALLDLVGRLGLWRRRVAAWKETAVEMENHLRGVFTGHVPIFLLAQALAFFSALSIFVRPWLFHVWTPELGRLAVQHVAVVYVITNLLNAVQLMPGNLGVLEGGLIVYFDQADDPAMPEPAAAAFLVVNRIADLALLVLGLLVLVRTGLRWWLGREARRQAAAEVRAPS